MNTTKIDILSCLSDGDWWTTREVAEQCGLGLTNASELLRRYRSQGLVGRRRNWDVPRGYKYRITDVGMARLEYLSSNEIRTSQVLTSQVGLKGAKKRAFDRWIKEKLGR